MYILYIYNLHIAHSLQPTPQWATNILLLRQTTKRKAHFPLTFMSSNKLNRMQTSTLLSPQLVRVCMREGEGVWRQARTKKNSPYGVLLLGARSTAGKLTRNIFLSSGKQQSTKRKHENDAEKARENSPKDACAPPLKNEE